jgi:hypothetical protein
LTGTVQPGVVISGSSSGDALRITQTGAGNALLVEDETNPDSSPFVVTAAGDVGIGTSSPAYKLDVNGSGNFSGAVGITGALTVGYGGTTADIIAKSSVANGGAGYSEFLFANSSTNTRGYLSYSHASDSLLIGTAGSTKATLDSSGNLGLGVTPSAWNSGYKAFVAGGTNSNNQVGGIASGSGITVVSTNYYRSATPSDLYAGDGFAMQYRQVSGQHQWYTAPSGTINTAISWTQAMTLDASGNLYLGVTSAAAGRLAIKDVSGSGNNVWLIGRSSDGTSSVSFRNNADTAYNARIECFDTGVMTFGTGTSATERARITSGGEFYIAGTTDQGAYNLQCNGTGVWGAGAYVNGSDERLKDDIQSLDSCLNVVNALRPVTFKYKPEHSKDQSIQTGFIAQELQQVLAGKPYLEGLVQEGPQHLNVAYQNIIPLLTKAIQEQQALIESLTSRVAQLEGTQP